MLSCLICPLNYATEKSNINGASCEADQVEGSYCSTECVLSHVEIWSMCPTACWDTKSRLFWRGWYGSHRRAGNGLDLLQGLRETVLYHCVLQREEVPSTRQIPLAQHQAEELVHDATRPASDRGQGRLGFLPVACVVLTSGHSTAFLGMAFGMAPHTSDLHPQPGGRKESRR